MNAQNSEQEIDGLYGLPLDQFTPARDELARRLRADGDREGGEAVKRLRKPSLTAWALNQVRRADQSAVQELIAAGDRLRDAQERLISAGEREPLGRAAAEERARVESLAADAGELLAGAGHPVSAAAQNKLSSTLHAVASNAEARELLLSGRLVRDYEISDLGFALAPAAASGAPERPAAAGASGQPAAAGASAQAPPARARAAKGSKSESAQEARARAAADAAIARKARGVGRRLERAQEVLREKQERLHEAERLAADARREAARAASALERAEAAAERADASARQAADRASELKAELAELEAGRPT
jgi:hypothetical protein